LDQRAQRRPPHMPLVKAHVLAIELEQVEGVQERIARAQTSDGSTQLVEVGHAVLEPPLDPLAPRVPRGVRGCLPPGWWPRLRRFNTSAVELGRYGARCEGASEWAAPPAGLRLYQSIGSQRHAGQRGIDRSRRRGHCKPILSRRKIESRI